MREAIGGTFHHCEALAAIDVNTKMLGQSSFLTTYIQTSTHRAKQLYIDIFEYCLYPRIPSALSWYTSTFCVWLNKLLIFHETCLLPSVLYPQIGRKSNWVQRRKPIDPRDLLRLLLPLLLLLWCWYWPPVSPPHTHTPATAKAASTFLEYCLWLNRSGYSVLVLYLYVTVWPHFDGSNPK